MIYTYILTNNYYKYMNFGKKLESFFNGKGLKAEKTEGTREEMEKRFQNAVDNPEEKFDGTKEDAPVKINEQNADLLQRAAEQSITGEQKLTNAEQANFEQAPKTSEPEIRNTQQAEKAERDAILEKIKEMPTNPQDDNPTDRAA